MRRVTIAICLVLASLTHSLQAQTPLPSNTNDLVRQLSRMDCIALALEQNLSLKVARYSPRVSYYDLRSAYGYYEPTFNLEARQRFDKSEQSFDAVGTPIPGSRGFENNFSSSFLNAKTPFGSSISLSANLAHQFSSRTDITGFNRLDDQYTGWASVDFRQDLLKNFWIDGNRLTIQLGKRSLKMSEYDLELAVMQVVTAVEKAYYELIAAAENVRVAEMSLRLNEQLLDETKQRVKAGVAIPLDEKQVEAEVATAKARLIQTRQLQITAENELKRLLTSDYAQWYNVHPTPAEKLVAIPETYNLNESWLMGISLRPDYNQAKLAVEMKGIEVKYQKNQLFPTLQFVMSYARGGVDRDGSFSGVLGDLKLENNANYTFGGVLSFPLGNTDARNRLKARRQEMEQLKARLQKAHLDILIDIENAVNEARSAFEQVQATREARIYAEQALDAERKKMENGKSTSFFVLDFQNQLTDKQAQEIRALADYNKALSELYFREGSTLERNRIEVEYK